MLDGDALPSQVLEKLAARAVGFWGETDPVVSSRWSKVVLASTDEPSEHTAALLLEAAWAAVEARDFDGARERMRQAEAAIATVGGDATSGGRRLLVEARIALREERYTQAIGLLEAGLDTATAIERADFLRMLALGHATLARLSDAREFLAASHRAARLPRQRALASINLAEASRRFGRAAEAFAFIRQTIEEAGDLALPRTLAVATAGRTLFDIGETDAAVPLVVWGREQLARLRPGLPFDDDDDTVLDMCEQRIGTEEFQRAWPPRDDPSPKLKH